MRLLVAEDHPTLARSIANGLREEGYSVDLTFDGSEAAHMLSSNNYDCVILDIMLPGKEGWDVLNDARSAGNLAPVLCLTARDTPEDRTSTMICTIRYAGTVSSQRIHKTSEISIALSPRRCESRSRHRLGGAPVQRGARQMRTVPS